MDRDDRRSRRESEDKSRHRSKHTRDRSRHEDSRRVRERSPRSSDDRRHRDRDRDRERRDRDKERERHHRERPEDKDALAEPEQKPNYESSGLLAKESNNIAGTALSYVEPLDAHKPDAKQQYRLFIFEGDDIIEKVDLKDRSWFLLGRDPVCHIRLDAPSVSKQHAAIQFRQIYSTNKYGDKVGKIKCYLIDIESSYGTKLNHDEVPHSRYIELKNKDMMQFGGVDTREYVLIVT